MEKEQKERKARGHFCGYYGGQQVFYNRPHFVLGKENRDFLGFLSAKDARKVGLRESGNSRSPLIYGAKGYIGPSRHRGKVEAPKD